MKKFEDRVPSNVFIDREDDISKKSISEMNEQLDDILKELNSKVINESDLDVFFNKIKAYKIDCGRFLYSKISDFCYDCDDIDTITGNVEKMYLNYTENDKEFEALLLKLYDHIQLVNVQKGTNDIFQQTISGDFKSTIENQNKELKQRGEEFRGLNIEIKNIKKDFLNQLISLIAIFIAVAFVLFGGINSLGSLTNSIEAVLTNKMTIDIINGPIILWGISMFNILYLFMYIVFKLTGKSRSIFNEDGKCNKIKLFLSKYLLFILTNCFLFYLYYKL